MSDRKLCGRITDHPAHFWDRLHGFGPLDPEGFLRRVEYRCPGHVAIEGGNGGGHRHHRPPTFEETS